MNDVAYSDIREVDEPTAVRALLQAGWTLLEIYLRKREVKFSDPKEFEDYPVYILGRERRDD